MRSMSAYLYHAKMKIQAALAYRFDVYAALVSNLIMILATAYLWKAAYKGIDAVNGIEQNQMITYAVLSVLMSSIYTFQVQNVMNRQVRQGNIAVDFIKPISVLGSYFFQDIGNSVSALANRLLPLLLVSFLFFGFLKPASLAAFLLFLLSCTLSYIILWIFSAMVGMTAFWFMALGNVGHVKDAIVRILSGSIVPLWFFPESIQTVSKYLPFIYTYQTPLGIFIGLIKPQQALESMIIQVFWIILLLLLLNGLWAKAKKSVLVQGG